MLAALTAFAITSVARLITGARALWLGCTPQPVQRLYYANHSSHGDFVLIWASLCWRSISTPLNTRLIRNWRMPGFCQ